MTVLRSARVVDGTGATARGADVVVEGGEITAMLERGDAPDRDVVDLGDLMLAPGFIDCHTHYDAQITWDPDLSPSAWHGVTTVVMGNCGFGIAPTRPEHRDVLARTLENVEGMSVEALRAGVRWEFETFPEYLDAIERDGTRLNVGALLGHTPLRFYAMGDAAMERAATPDEIAEMRRILSEALDAGALGLGSSRTLGHSGIDGRPVPSRVAAVDEVFELAQVLHDHSAGIVQMTPGPDLDVVELSQLARASTRPVTWTALGDRPGLTRKDVLDLQSEHGGEVYPQIACRPVMAQLTLAEPAPLSRCACFREALAVPRSERADLYRDPAWRARARADMRVEWGHRWDRISIGESQAAPELVGGPTLAELAEARGVDPVDVLCDLALAEGLNTRFNVVLGNGDEHEVAALLGDERALLAVSDAGAHASQICDAVFATHLLQRFVRELNVLSWEAAVWRLTGHPAHAFRIARRGRIAPGFGADLVAFDPATVGVQPMQRVWDFPAGADRLVAGSIGIEHVWVNGVPIRSHGADLELDGARPGRVLRKEDRDE
jgi:N-acyl-D-aspartate/D-glutamate deacylase